MTSVRLTLASLAVSITTTLWDRREAMHQTRLAEASSIFDPVLAQTISRLEAQALSPLQAVATLVRQQTALAYYLAAQDFFWISGCLCIALIPMVWFARRSVSAGIAASE
jgi:DHA2 family multidrug resistance protein